MADHMTAMTAEQTDQDLIAEVVARYTADPVPPCRVCGGALSIQSCGGGGNATVWGCSGMEDDPERPGYMRYMSGRRCADDHYSQSRWTQYRGGDSDVIELARRFHALAARLSGMAAVRLECEQLGMAIVDHIADDGHRNALGGICATSVQGFARDTQIEFAQKNGMQIRAAAPEPPPDCAHRSAA